MEKLKVIIMLPIGIFGLLLLTMANLIRKIQGKPTVEEEWHKDYVDSNMNHGQGKKRE